MKPLFQEKIKTWLPVPEKKRKNLKKLFSLVAPKYQAVTRMLSLGRDASWKKMLVRQLPTYQAPECLDLACGTGDLCFLLAQRFPEGRIQGLDFNDEMLAKAHERNNFKNISFINQDMCNLKSISSGSIDIVTGGYALRNAPDLNSALNEVFRVLKVGGIASFLDFSKPPKKWLQKMHYVILKSWGSLWGVLFHGRPEVYAYLAESLSVFPDREQLKQKFKSHGFQEISSQLLFGGMLEIIQCKKGSE